MIWGFAGISGSFLVAVFSVNQLHAAVPVYRLAFSQRAPRNARPYEVGGGCTVRLRWFHAGIHVLQGRACFPRRSHLRVDDQHAAQSPCLAILVPLGMWRLIDNKRHRGSGGWPHPLPAFYKPRSRSDAPVTSRYTRYVAIHPICRGAPDQKGCNAYGSGAPPPTTSPTVGNSSPQTPTVRIGRSHTSSKCSPRLRTRGAAPLREHYTS